MRSSLIHSFAKAVASAMALILLCNGFACSFFASRTQIVSVSSAPSGARVVINGENAGVTPLQYSIRRNDESAIMVNKPGYETANRRTTRSLSTVGIVDIIGGCIWLVPFLGLISAGAWEQEPANFSVNLAPAEK